MSTTTTSTTTVSESAIPDVARLVFTKKAISVSSNQLSKLSTPSVQCTVHRDTPSKGCEYCMRTSPPMSNITKSMESSNFARSSNSTTNNFGGSTAARKPFTANKTSISSLGSDDSDKTASTATTSPPSSPVKTSPLKNRRITSESILPSLRQAPKVNLLGLSRPASPDSVTSVTSAATATSTMVRDATQSQDTLVKTHSSLPASPVTSSIKLPRSNSFAVPPPRQLRSLKTPLYMPSVLRRTQTSDNFAALSKQYLQHQHSRSSLGGGSSTPPNLNALSTPSQTHWKPDNSRSACTACGDSFSLFLRRHHCRKCGDLFCDKDTAQEIRLDADCQFHVLGSKVKACNGCYREYLEFMKTVVVDHTAPPSNTTSARHYYSHSTTNCYNTGSLQLVGAAAAATPAPAAESFTSSSTGQYSAVPANWSWSTF